MTHQLMAQLGAPWALLIEAVAAIVIYLVGKQRGRQKGHQEITGSSSSNGCDI